MGEAHRFQRPLIDDALAGVRSVFAEYSLLDTPIRCVGPAGGRSSPVRARRRGSGRLRGDRRHPLRERLTVHEGQRIATITNPFKKDEVVVKAPFTGLLIGLLENPVVYPGNPLCHLVEIDESTRRAIEPVTPRSPSDSRTQRV